MATKAKPHKRKRCGASGCGKLATHCASRGYFTFYLCGDCALKAHQPPLNARHVEPLLDTEA